MNFIKIKGLQDNYPEGIEGTSEWYYCKIAEDPFCDLYEAEEIIKAGHTYKGMNCALIHFPDGTVYEPFTLQENVYVDAPVFLDGVLYFLVTDFNEKTIQIVAWGTETKQPEVVKELLLDEVENCYNLMLRVAPIMLIQEANDDVLEIIYPEKKTIQLGECESMYFRNEDKLYCSAWYEDPEYHEKVIVRNYYTGEIEEIFDKQNMRRMPNGDVWMLGKA